jgi:nitrite reductase/ring-hydroxylating ferredoxin subunit
MSRKTLLILLLGFVIITSWGCRDRIAQVPDVPVDIVVNINQPAFFDLTVPTGWVYLTGGSRGIILYRLNTEEFIAFERHSPFEPENNCSVIVENDGVIISDPCSDSSWLITDGSIVTGPTSFPLVTYDVRFTNPYVYITN